MLARNPKTGKDLRIINLDTSVWRDQKTLVWFDTVPTDKRWNRWDIGCVDTNVADALHAAGLPADIVICLNDSAQAWLESGNASKARVIIIPQALIKSMGMDKLLELKMNNILCVDEMHDLYPFLGKAWDGTVEDAKAMVALSLHMGRSFPVKASEQRTQSCLEKGLKLLETGDAPQELWLVTQYYDPGKGKRKVEIDECLKKNIECPMIDRIVLLNEKTIGPKHEKIQEKVIGKRLTYADVIRWIHDEAPDVMIVFANADIFLDDSNWRTLWSTDMITKPKFLALLRWDVQGTTPDDIRAAKLFGPRADSQDTWVISARAVKAIKWDWSALNFPFGQGGCDNAITLEMFKQRFLVANPALTLRTYHYHTSEVRTYDPRNIVDKPAYLYIQPTGLHDMRPVIDLGKPFDEFKRASFPRPIKGPLSHAQAKTFCSMMKRNTEEKLLLDATEMNFCTPPPVPIYEMKDIFETRDGLVYSYDSIFVGKTKASTDAWSESQLSSMSASLLVEEALIAPLPDSIAKDAGEFILKYMSKIFLLREHMPAGEFWCPKKRECIEAIKMFQWPNKEIPVLSRDENQQIWCKKALMWPYEDKLPDLISKEEIGALRKNLGLGGWKSVITTKKLVLIVDSSWVAEELDEYFEEGLAEFGISVKLLWPERTSLDICIQTLQGSWGLVMGSRAMAAWSWVLPVGAHVWEIQSEMEPNASLLHLCSAADLKYRLQIVAKGVPNKREKDTTFGKLLNDMKELLNPLVEKQTLILPSKRSDFFGHAGDSFREMAHLWGDLGYVSVVEKPVEQIWLGGVGETLLYDRPTLEWLQRSKETDFKMALFGNPVPPMGGRAWSFWPRRPALVEEVVKSGAPSKSYEAREKTLVFYGRSENAVQLKRRTGFNWQEVCDDFSHLVSTGEYAYTQKEYLHNLANAKYGLCLAGYGNKCHREIECMSMGCVPIVSLDVDMSSYADPPEEGLHYFRVKNPQEARIAIQVTADRWTVMSAACRDWWQRNASAEGMWKLTLSLTS